MTVPLVRTEFAVQMTCETCSDKVKRALAPLPLAGWSLNLPSQTVSIESRLPPSRLLATLRSTGLTTVLRGVSSALADASTPYTIASAAVCIFESFRNAPSGWATDVNKGLCRMVQINPNEVFLDLSVEGLRPQTAYQVDVHECGDLSRGAQSTGNAMMPIGRFLTDMQGRGELVTEMQGVAVWQLIGRSIVMHSGNPSDAVAGIIARTSGLFENTKRVCSCTGKTLWEESSRL